MRKNLQKATYPTLWVDGSSETFNGLEKTEVACVEQPLSRCSSVPCASGRSTGCLHSWSDACGCGRDKPEKADLDAKQKAQAHTAGLKRGSGTITGKPRSKQICAQTHLIIHYGSEGLGGGSSEARKKSLQTENTETRTGSMSTLQPIAETGRAQPARTNPVGDTVVITTSLDRGQQQPWIDFGDIMGMLKK